MSYAAYIKLTLPDPPPYERIRQQLAIDKMEVVFYALGAAMLELRQPENVRLFMSGKLDAEKGMAIVQEAATKGAYRGLAEQADRMESAVKAIREAIAFKAPVQKKTGAATRKAG